MKRDLDLVRSILKWMEAQSTGFSDEIEGAFPRHTDEEVGFHIHLMGQAGLLMVEDDATSASNSPSAVPMSITWDGYEFLDAANDSVLWAKAKKNVISPAGSVAFTVLLEWLKAEAKTKLGLPS